MTYMQPSGFSRLWIFSVAWLPVLLGITVICVESTTTMSAANTGTWLLEVSRWLWGHADESSVATANFFLRKLGHFCGYGTLGLLFWRAWVITFRMTWKGPRSRLLFSASALAVVCTFFVASMDELHQSILPGRTSSFHDVLLDTCGAVLFNRVMMFILRRRRAPVESPPAWAR